MDPLSNFKERIEQYCFATYRNFLLQKHYDTVASVKSKNGQNMEVFQGHLRWKWWEIQPFMWVIVIRILLRVWHILLKLQLYFFLRVQYPILGLTSVVDNVKNSVTIGI